MHQNSRSLDASMLLQMLTDIHLKVSPSQTEDDIYSPVSLGTDPTNENVTLPTKADLEQEVEKLGEGNSKNNTQCILISNQTTPFADANETVEAHKRGVWHGDEDYMIRSWDKINLEQEGEKLEEENNKNNTQVDLLELQQGAASKLIESIGKTIDSIKDMQQKPDGHGVKALAERMVTTKLPLISDLLQVEEVERFSMEQFLDLAMSSKELYVE